MQYLHCITSIVYQYTQTCAWFVHPCCTRQQPLILVGAGTLHIFNVPGGGTLFMKRFVPKKVDLHAEVIKVLFITNVYREI